MVMFFLKVTIDKASLIVNGTLITSKTTIKVIGVNFDSKLNWQSHIQMAITKAKKALQAIKLIRKHFNNT